MVIARPVSFLLFVAATFAISSTQNTDQDGSNTGTRLRNGFGFMLLRSPAVTSSAPKTSTTVPKNKTAPTTAEPEYTTEPFSIFTFWDTTYESGTTAEAEVNLIRTTEATIPTSGKRTLPRSTTSRPTTKSTTRKTFPPSTTTTKRTSSTTPLPLTSTKQKSIATEEFEMKNTGMIFTVLSGIGTTAAKTTKLKKNPAMTTTMETVTLQESTDADIILVETTDFDYMTTDDGNGSFIIAGPVEKTGGWSGYHKDHDSIVAAWKNVFPYYRYILSPHKFWAENWYLILIILILLILFFIIPGFCCQLHWHRLRKGWRNFKCCHKSKEKDIEKGEKVVVQKERALAVSDVPDSGRASAVLSTSSGVESVHSDVNEATDHDKMSSHHSLAESGIHLQKEDDSPQNASKEIDALATSPNDADSVIVTRLSQSTIRSNSSKDRSFGFPEPAESNMDNLTEMPIQRASILSQSDNGLDIGNETIIKSNPVDKNPRVDRSGLPPLRPPKPDYMIPPAVGPHVAPESRARRKKEGARSKSPTKERRGRHEKPKGQEKPAARGKTPRGRPRGEKERKKDKSSDAKRRKQQSDKKKVESSKQSLMRAAQSLEDLLDAITKLTREYPIPELPGEERGVGSQKKPRKRTRSLMKRPREKRKSKRRNKSLELPRVPHEQNERELSKTKKKRTQSWAKEQKRLEKGKSKKKRREDGERAKSKEREPKPERKKKNEKEGEKEGKSQEEKSKGKVPTLMKQELDPVDRTKQERRRMRLERDLKKLQKYHNSRAEKAEKQKDTTEAIANAE